MPGSNDLTPVRIRGKKQHSKPVDAGPGSSTIVHRTSSQPSSPLPGRSRRTRKGRLQDVGLSSSRPDTSSATSPLERLPTELLEDIFFRCLNLSLPRASLALGQQLASYHVKSKLYALAFSGVPLSRVGYRLEAESFLIDILKIGNDEQGLISKFQSDVLALRWMTPTFLRHSMDRLLIKTTVMAFNELDIGWIKSENAIVESSSSQSLTEAMTEFYKLARSRTDSILSNIDAESGRWCYETNKEEVSFNLRLQQSFPHSVTIRVCTSGLNFDTGPHPLRTRVISFRQLLYCQGGCRIPQKLLHGPWSIPKCAMLAQLVKSGCRLDQSGSTTDEEVASQGLKDAIAQSFIRAIVTLVGSRRDRKEIYDDTGWGRNQGDIRERLKYFHTSYVGVSVTTEHLKFALDNNSSMEVLECLIDAMRSNIDWQDEEIREYMWETNDDRRSFLRSRCCDDNDIKRYILETGVEPDFYDQAEIPSASWIRSKPSWHGEREFPGYMEAYFMTA
ncbi:hypothetical protein G7Y79_00055g089930 [Physcia stellaris]|nr:hypothetical protein G7Y79_00055g089930 [Physcia stellaris]